MNRALFSIQSILAGIVCLLLLFSGKAYAHEVTISTPSGDICYGDNTAAYYSKQSKAVSLIEYIGDTCVGLDVMEDKWKRMTGDAPIYEGMLYTHFGDEVNAFFTAYDVAKEYSTGDQSVDNLLVAAGIRAFEGEVGITHLAHYQENTVNAYDKLKARGVSMCKAVEDLAKSYITTVTGNKEFYKIVDEETVEKYKADVVYLVTAGDVTVGQNAKVTTSAEQKENSNANTNKTSAKPSSDNGDASAEGNGGSVDHSDGISEEELLEELSYLDSLGLSEEEFDQQLEAWAAAHGVN